VPVVPLQRCRHRTRQSTIASRPVLSRLAFVRVVPQPDPLLTITLSQAHKVAAGIAPGPWCRVGSGLVPFGGQTKAMIRTIAARKESTARRRPFRCFVTGMVRLILREPRTSQPRANTTRVRKMNVPKGALKSRGYFDWRDAMVFSLSSNIETRAWIA